MPIASDFLGGVAGGFFGNDYLRDFRHASKTFRAANYQNAPKFKFLFHVYFDINTEAFASPTVGTSLGSNFGVLVKSVKLPSFTFATHDLNQYNRKRIVQTKIKYDPIDIAFHDDNNNLINSLWYKYYTYYYADGTKPKVVFSGNRGGQTTPDITGGGGATTAASAASYNSRTLYNPSITGNDTWGYVGETGVPGNASTTKIPFFKNITVFGLAQHDFIAYTLINPIITKFNHDTYDYDQGNGIMSHTMTIDYETVVYNKGSIDGQTPGNLVTGFGDQQNYDRQLSPISTPGSNGRILGPGGLIDGAGGTISALENGQYLKALKTAGQTYNSAKNLNLKSTISSEIGLGILNALRDDNNVTRQKLFDIPTVGQTPSNIGTAGAPPLAQQQPALPNPNWAGSQDNVNGPPSDLADFYG